MQLALQYNVWQNEPVAVDERTFDFSVEYTDIAADDDDENMPKQKNVRACARYIGKGSHTPAHINMHTHTDAHKHDKHKRIYITQQNTT